MIPSRAYRWVACVSIIGLSACCAGVTESIPEMLVQLQKDNADAYHGVVDMQMYVTEVIDAGVLAAISGPDSGIRIVKISEWRGTPLALTARIGQGELRVRNEPDFFVLWNRRDAAVSVEGTPLDVVRRATEGILSAAYQPGPAGNVATVGSPANKGWEIRLLSGAGTLPGTTALTCSYTNEPSARRWPYVSSIHVIVNDRDVVIVCEKAKARQMGDLYVYQGLLAAKARLSVAEAKDLASQGVLARNAIFDENVNLAKLPSAMLNGAMWPLAGAVNTDVCSAKLLRASEKPVSTPIQSSDQEPARETTK